MLDRKLCQMATAYKSSIVILRISFRSYTCNVSESWIRIAVRKNSKAKGVLWFIIHGFIRRWVISHCYKSPLWTHSGMLFRFGCIIIFGCPWRGKALVQRGQFFISVISEEYVSFKAPIISSLDEFHFRRLENSVVEKGKAA